MGAISCVFRFALPFMVSIGEKVGSYRRTSWSSLACGSCWYGCVYNVSVLNGVGICHFAVENCVTRRFECSNVSGSG